MSAPKVAKRKRGRPAGPPELVRRRILLIRLTDMELGVLTGAAETAGESVAEWVRRLAWREAMRPFGGSL